MGLDSVELVLEVETTFDITIPDEEASEIRTVGELHKSILDKLATKDTEPTCGTQKAFYKLRQSLINCFGVDRQKIRTRTATEDIFPRTDRRRIWDKFCSYIDLRLPDLRRPTWLLYVLGIILLVLLVTIGLKGGIWASVLLFPVLLYVLTFSTRPLAVEFPLECRSLGGLTQTLLRMNYAKISQGEHTDKEVWNVLCSVIADQLAVKKDELKPETNFVKDLNLD